MTKSNGHVRIVEVGPRDGLQSISDIILLQDKIKYINLLTESCLPEIEVTSFVSPKWVPQLADAIDVSRHINKNNHTRYTALVPNNIGLENAIKSEYKSIALFTAASEAFSMKNIHCSIEDSFKRFNDMAPLWGNLHVRGYISTVWHCPFEGEINAKSVIPVIEKYIDLGIQDISLGDTIGKATADETEKLLTLLLSRWDASLFSLHCHDTYDFASKNIRKGIEMGIRSFDSSAGGIGGCPYAPGASGNISTEKLIDICETSNLSTGINRDKLKQAGQFIQSILEKDMVHHAKN
mgnify:FL=1